MSPTTIVSPSYTTSPLTTRALWVARAPHQQRRLDLQWYPFVGDLEQPLRALEQPTAEVGDQPEGVDLDFELVDDAGQLVALLGAVELRLVADEVVDRPVLQGQRMEVEIRRHVDRRGRHAEPARHLVALAVEARQQKTAEVAAGEVVVDLQRDRALPGAHRPEAEAEQAH